MIEYRTRISGKETGEVYEEYSFPRGILEPGLDIRALYAAEKVAFWSVSLDISGNTEPLRVEEDLIAYTDSDIAKVRQIS